MTRPMHSRVFVSVIDVCLEFTRAPAMVSATEFQTNNEELSGGRAHLTCQMRSKTRSNAIQNYQKFEPRIFVVPKIHRAGSRRGHSGREFFVHLSVLGAFNISPPNPTDNNLRATPSAPPCPCGAVSSNHQSAMATPYYVRSVFGDIGNVWSGSHGSLCRVEKS